VTDPTSQARGDSASRPYRNAEWLREAEKRGYTVSAGEAYIRAALCYHFGKMRWLKVLEQKADYYQAQCQVHRHLP
jgi:hypothetical protein